jgi:type I restriction enzyme S subunit
VRTLRIGDFCETGSGGTPARDKSDRYFKNGTIPWVKSGELRESTIYDTEEKITQAALAETAAKMVSPGALLVPMYGATVGRVGTLGVAAATNQAVCHIVPDQSIAHPRYLYFALKSSVPSLLLRRVGGAQPNISQGIIQDVKVPLPPLAEQRRIAEILDKADALRAKRRAALAQLDTLTQSIFVDMFGDPVGNSRWPVASLGSVLTSMRYGPRFYDEEYAEDGIRIVRITDLSEGGSLDYKAMPKLRVAAQDFEKSALRPGDVIFARSGATVGKTALIRNEDPPSIAGAYFIVLRFDERFDPVYADAVLRCPSVRAIVTRRSRQAAQQNFSGPGLRELPFPVPPSDLQREFSCKVTAVARTIRTNEASASGMDALFASIQHRAFRCEL